MQKNVIEDVFGTKVFNDDGFVFDIRDYIKNDIIKSLLPNKALIIKKEDFENIYNN